MKWGIISTAGIAANHVLPAMAKTDSVELVAIGSANSEKATQIASQFEIASVYDSYEAVLEDEAVEAVYIPLPNHLHIPWIKKALLAGKHVLCEKPMALNADEVRSIQSLANETGLQVAEAFMVRHHPQWHQARDIVQSGQLGRVTSIQATFSYFNDDPNNIRNQADIGGGAMMDVGVYPIALSRFVLGQDPLAVQCNMDKDPKMGTDRVSHAQLYFEDCVCQFMVSTQTTLCQRFTIHGSKARLDLEIPYNVPGDKDAILVLDNGSTLDGSDGRKIITAPATNHFSAQTLAFQSYCEGHENNPHPLSDSLTMMTILDALVASDHQSGQMIKL